MNRVLFRSLLLSLLSLNQQITGAPVLEFVSSYTTAFGMSVLRKIVTSPDGDNLYSLSGDLGLKDSANAINSYTIDKQTGMIKILDSRSYMTWNYELRNSRSLAISPEGKNLYVTSRAWNSNLLNVYIRGEEAAKIYDVEIDSVPDVGYGEAIAVSPDGRNVYVGYSYGLQNNALVVYTREPDSGKVEAIEFNREGQNGISGMQRINACAVSPDGMHVYTASGYGGATNGGICVFSREKNSGRLIFIKSIPIFST